MILIDTDDLAYFQDKLKRAKYPTEIRKIINQIRLLKFIMELQS